MKIRPAKRSDISQMIDIIKLNNDWYSKDLALKEIKEMFSKSLIKPTYFVVEDKGKILAFNGFAHSWVDNSVVSFFWANTNPNDSGKGFQSKLIKHMVKHVKAIKKPKVKMIIISTKIPKFFTKFGFKTLGTKYDKDYVLMSRQLNET